MSIAKTMLTPLLSMSGVQGVETASGRTVANPFTETDMRQFGMSPEDHHRVYKKMWGERRHPRCYVREGSVDSLLPETVPSPVNLTARQALEKAIANGKIKIRTNPWPMAAFYVAAPFLTLCAATLYVQTLPDFNAEEFDKNILFYASMAVMIMIAAPMLLTDLSSFWEFIDYTSLRRTAKRTVFCGVKDVMPLWKFLNVSPFDVERVTIGDLEIQKKQVNQVNNRLVSMWHSLNYTPVEACNSVENVLKCVGRRVFAHRMQIQDVSVDDIKVMQDGTIITEDRNQNFDSGKKHKIFVRAQMAQASKDKDAQSGLVFEIETNSTEDFKNKLDLLLSGEALSAVGKVRAKGFFGLLVDQIYRIRCGDLRIMDITKIDRNNYNDNGMGVYFHTLMRSTEVET